MNVPKVISHITDWLRDYAGEAGAEGFVVGVSGGIDSAVTSTLGARTGLPVLCLEMPIHQSGAQVSRARRHIAALGERFADVAGQEVELTPVFTQFVAGLPTVEDGPAREMSLVNTRARLRMATLYYFAALMGRLVLGTGNKVEDFGVGFFTKYGDGGVDVSPIADLTKTEVYALGRALGVIDEIMTAPPTGRAVGRRPDRRGSDRRQLPGARMGDGISGRRGRAQLARTRGARDLPALSPGQPTQDGADPGVQDSRRVAVIGGRAGFARARLPGWPLTGSSPPILT